MTGRVLIYGANGFSGSRIAERLADLGDGVVLAGRDADKVGAVAERLRRPMRVFGLEHADAIDHGLGDISLVLNAAGPYRQTAAPVMASCLRMGADYLDLTGEWPVFAAAMEVSPLARAAKVMLMPGAGVAIAITDCLLAAMAEQAPDAVKLRVAISHPHQMSRGSVETMLGLFDGKTLVRRQGGLERLAAGRLARDFDFGEGRRRAVSFSWPDVVTGQFTTGVANIEAYTQADWASRAVYRLAGNVAPFSEDVVRRAASAWPDRPPAESLEAAGYSIVAEAEDAWRRTSALRLRIHDGYGTTTETANAIVRRVLSGDRRPGFQTPGKLFGGRFLQELGYVASNLMAA